MAIKRRRDVNVRPLFRKNVKGDNDEKSQLSLEMGGEEYREYVRDRAGIEDEDFIEPGAAVNPDDMKGSKLSDEDQDREKDQDFGKEAEHVAELAGDLNQASEEQADVSAEVADRKYRRRIAKAGKVGEMKEMLKVAAARTESKVDDAVAEQVSSRNIDDLPDIKDESVCECDYVAGAAERYFG